jgi:ABC-type multidrug transport system fused ATPase/permease subunit
VCLIDFAFCFVLFCFVYLLFITSLPFPILLGAIVSAISDDTLDFETGISVKFGEGIQALSTLISGFAVAFYFSWEITLACCATVPLIVLSFGVILANGEGFKGKDAFEAAASVATETLSAMQTVISFGGEVKAAERFEGRLCEAEKSAIKQGNRLGWGNGLLWGAVFGMMAISFWVGGKMVIDSTNAAMVDHPIPSIFSGPFVLDSTGAPVPGHPYNTYFFSHSIAMEACKYRDIGSFGELLVSGANTHTHTHTHTHTRTHTHTHIYRHTHTHTHTHTCARARIQHGTSESHPFPRG